jgi:hypothetical protein
MAGDSARARRPFLSPVDHRGRRRSSALAVLSIYPPVTKVRSTPRPSQIQRREKILHGGGRGVVEGGLQRDASPVDGGDKLFLQCSTSTVKEERRRSMVADWIWARPDPATTHRALPPLLPRREFAPGVTDRQRSGGGGRRCCMRCGVAGGRGGAGGGVAF